jgi:RNA polymerase sigma-70 factor (ECF subfamily)
MAAVADKDADAQRTLVKRLAGRVRRITSLMCSSSADADDAAQLALMEILSSARAFRYASSLEGWADRITARTALRQARRERQRRSYLARWLPPGWLPWGRAAVVAQGDRFTVEQLLSRLSPSRREAFVLRHALGFTVNEIGELTNTRVGTIKDRLVASRKQLRRWLGREAQRREQGGEP